MTGGTTAAWLAGASVDRLRKQARGDFGVAVFAQLSDKQGSLTVREHYASLWSLSIKTLVPNILNATWAQQRNLRRN